ncbi:MAG: helix-turn-helix domain-containing protein [Rhodopila sp.]|nr:helix-turn-helix domain-containing protein [Rhodopila sp.]
MTNSWLPEGFERLARTPGEPRVSDGSPAALLIEWAGDIREIKTISAIRALARRWTPLLRAKRTVEAMLEHKRAFILVPKLESFDALAAELAEAGVKAITIANDDVDVKAIRERLGLTQEQFALHYGLELDAVRNWEHGRRKPDTAAQSYLRAIRNDPEAVEAALWGT